MNLASAVILGKIVIRYGDGEYEYNEFYPIVLKVPPRTEDLFFMIDPSISFLQFISEWQGKMLGDIEAEIRTVLNTLSGGKNKVYGGTYRLFEGSKPVAPERNKAIFEEVEKCFTTLLGYCVKFPIAELDITILIKSNFEGEK